MTRSAVLADVLYKTAIDLKKYTASQLRWCKNRQALLQTLNTMQFLLQCIGMKTILEEQSSSILRCYKDLSGCSSMDFEDAFKNAHPATADYSADYEELLLRMAEILSRCSSALTKREKITEKSLRERLWPFTIFPEPFCRFRTVGNSAPKKHWHMQNTLKFHQKVLFYDSVLLTKIIER